MRHSIISISAALVLFFAARSGLAGEFLELRAGKIPVTPAVVGSLKAQGAAIPEVFVAQWAAPVTFEQQKSLEARGFRQRTSGQVRHDDLVSRRLSPDRQLH